MKKILATLLIAASIAFVQCDKNDDNPNITQSQVTTTVSSGSWRVTYFFDTDHEETANFSGYTFTFAGNNVLTAVNGGSTVTGTWAAGTDDSKTKLIIGFISPNSFEDLSEDWQVIELTSNKIRLEHKSGGNGGTDQLTFERN